MTEKKVSKLYNRLVNFSESLWNGFVNIDEILEYRYIPLGDKHINSTTEKILYRSNLAIRKNILMYLSTYHVENEEPYFVLNMFETDEDTLKNTDKFTFSVFFGTLFSITVKSNSTVINKSSGLNAYQINDLILEIENMLYNYMYERKNLDENTLHQEVLKLEKM